MSDLDIYVDSVNHFRKSSHYILNQVLFRLKRTNLTYRLIDSLNINDTGRCAFLHIDLTDIPEEFKQVVPLYKFTINGKATTINRRIYSRSMLSEGDSYQGPVIVKTVLNHMGLPELRYKKNKKLAALLRYKFRRIFDHGFKEKICPSYVIYNSLKKVPAMVWDNTDLIVEKFIPGSLKLPVTKHRYDFFFDCKFITCSVFDSLLCDPLKVVKVEAINELPDEVSSLRNKLNLDFGSIDYFVQKDKAIIIDANKTTTVTSGWIEEFPPLDRYLSDISGRLLEMVKAT